MIPNTEVELLEWMKENLRHAAEHCKVLSHHPLRGFVYDAFRRELKNIEQSCNRMGYFRNGDARWLPVGMMMAEAHRRAGNWLRKSASEDARNAVHPMFLKLSENLMALYGKVVALETEKTGVRRSILPVAMTAPHRSGRPVQVRRPSGLIIPEGVALH